jgi:hypothetical protein
MNSSEKYTRQKKKDLFAKQLFSYSTKTVFFNLTKLYEYKSEQKLIHKLYLIFVVISFVQDYLLIV